MIISLRNLLLFRASHAEFITSVLVLFQFAGALVSCQLDDFPFTTLMFFVRVRTPTNISVVQMKTFEESYNFLDLPSPHHFACYYLVEVRPTVGVRVSTQRTYSLLETLKFLNASNTFVVDARLN
jgi:hypothetical protein